MIPNRVYLLVRPSWSQTMAREELKWQNIDADDLPAEVKKSFDAMVEAEATFKADLEKLLKNEGHMPEDKFLVMSRKGKRLGVAFASTGMRFLFFQAAAAKYHFCSCFSRPMPRSRN